MLVVPRIAPVAELFG